MKIRKSDLIQESIFAKRHESGLWVYVMPRAGFQKSYAAIGANFGSIDNAFRTEGGGDIYVPDGVAHFLEHKLFESEEGGNVFDLFSKFGSNANAFTSFDMTVYLFSAAGNLFENLKILLDFVQKPYFTKENVEKEQGIIGQEIRMYDDLPEWRVYFNLLGALYKNHPVRIDIAGTGESIAKIDAGVLYKCYDAFYHPKNMALFVTGDTDAQKVLDLVDNLVKPTERKSVSERILPPEPPEVAADYAERRMSVSRPQFMLGFKESPGGEAGYLKREALYSVMLELVFGKSSPLYKRLYDENLIDESFSAGYTQGSGYAFVSAGSGSKDPGRARDLILSHIAAVRENGFDEDDFERVRRMIYGRFTRVAGKMEGFANTYLAAAFKGACLLDYPRVLLDITNREVSDLISTAVRADRAALSVVSPL